MTTINETARPKDRTVFFNRLLYGAFIALAVYFLVTYRIAEVMSNLGIAIIFDPLIKK